MRSNPCRLSIVLLCAFVLLIPAVTAVADEPIADVILKSDAVLFQPRIEAESFELTVTSPCGIIITREFDGRDIPTFALEDLQVENVDGNYTYNLRVRPILSGAEKELLADLRKNGDANDVARLRTDGQLFKQIPSQGGDFVVFKGAIVTKTGLQESQKRTAVEESRDPSGLTFNNGGADLAGTGGLQNLPAADFVILDDLIVDGSACIGFDCVNGESFGFDTIRLKENNLRIKFDDTSTAASFPRNDWQLTANDSANGGASKFSIDDISGGRTPFTVEANAPSHSLYVDDGGRIGLGTSTPSVEIHTIDGDTPTLRLQQDGSSGFAPQTWDVAGNETNFFIRDVTNGSTLPFRIRPGAPTSSIFIDVDGDVGLHTSSPDAALHILGSDGDTQLHVEETSGTVTARNMMVLENNGGVRFSLERSDTGGIWQITALANFNINDPSDGNTEFQLSAGGDLTIEGDYFSTTCTAGNPCAPDYVFEPDYDLLSLEQVRTFVTENKHLPNVPSAKELTGPINISKMQMTLLEKIEELTLYTLEQDAHLQAQQEDLARLAAENAALKANFAALEAMVKGDPAP
jgi:hypothetical protein